MVKKFKKLLDNISKQPNQTSEFKALGSVVTMTSDPERIQDLYLNKNLGRSEISRRITSHIGASHGWVSQDDDKALIKKHIFKKHLSSTVYKSISLDVLKRVDEEFKKVIEDKALLNSHHLLVKVIINSFLEHLLKVDIPHIVRQSLDGVGLFEKDAGFSTSIPKLFFLNYSKHVPNFIKNIFAYDLKIRNDKLKTYSEQLYSKCSGKKNSLYNSLKEAEQAGLLTKQDVVGEFKMVLINATSMAGSLMWMLYVISKNSTHTEAIANNADYSRMSFMEVLRLFPPFHMLSYEQKQSKCPINMFKSKNTEFISVWGTHLSEVNWKDSSKFDPNRFYKGLSNITKGSYIPFGGGSRACPGSGLVMAIGPTLMQHVCNNYNLTTVKDPVIKRRVELLPEGNTILFNLTNK